MSGWQPRATDFAAIASSSLASCCTWILQLGHAADDLKENFEKGATDAIKKISPKLKLGYLTLE